MNYLFAVLLLKPACMLLKPGISMNYLFSLIEREEEKCVNLIT